MDGKALDAMDRMARNLPVKQLKTIRQNTKLGEIYIAYGRGKDTEDKDVWHGMYVLDEIEGIGALGKGPIELNGNLREKQAKQVFFDLAYQDAEVFRCPM